MYVPLLRILLTVSFTFSSAMVKGDFIPEESRANAKEAMYCPEH